MHCKLTNEPFSNSIGKQIFIAEMNRVNRLPNVRYVPDTKKVIKLTEEDFERTVRLVYGENAPTDFLLLKRELFQ